MRLLFLLCLAIIVEHTFGSPLNVPIKEPAESSGTKTIDIQPSDHWLSAYHHKHPGPVPDIFVGSYVLPHHYIDFLDRLRDLGALRE